MIDRRPSGDTDYGSARGGGYRKRIAPQVEDSYGPQAADIQEQQGCRLRSFHFFPFFVFGTGAGRFAAVIRARPLTHSRSSSPPSMRKYGLAPG